MEENQSRSLGYNLLYALSVWLGCFLFLGLINVNKIFSLLSRDAQQSTLSGSLNSVLEIITIRLDQLPYVRTLVTFLFWLLVGFVVYGVVLFIGGAVAAAGQERDMLKEYRYPSFQKKDSLLRSIMVHWAFAAGLALVWLFLFALLVFTLPVARNLFLNGPNNPGSFAAWTYTIGATTAFAFVFFATVWVGKMFWRATKLLGNAS